MAIDLTHPDPGAQIDLDSVLPQVWGYARVSTDEQKHALQIDALRAAGVPPWRLVEETASGAKARPRLAELLNRLGRDDTLVVWKVDRLGRHAAEALLNADRLRERGVRLVITTLGVDTATPAGRLMYGVLAQFAEFEREQIVERTKAGLAAARARGKVLGRKRSLTPPQRQHALDLHRKGHSYPQIAELVGVSPATVYRAIREMKAVAEAAEGDPSGGGCT